MPVTASPTDLRSKAKECRRRADASDTPERRSHWLFMEREWLHLAESTGRMQEKHDAIVAVNGLLP
jgi:hypothetical protein